VSRRLRTATECALERLHLGGVHPPFLVAEVRVVRAAGDDEGVVAEPLRRSDGPYGAEVQLSRAEVEVSDLGEQDADAAMTLKDRAERIGDLARRKRARRDLIGERLEEMKVAAVDERDLDRCTPKLQDRLEAAEASSDDDDAVCAGVEGVHSAHYFGCVGPVFGRAVGAPGGSRPPLSSGRLASGPV
jgi:hypothetical protein